MTRGDLGKLRLSYFADKPLKVNLDLSQRVIRTEDLSELNGVL